MSSIRWAHAERGPSADVSRSAGAPHGRAETRAARPAPSAALGPLLALLVSPAVLPAQQAGPGPCVGAECCARAEGAALSGTIEHVESDADLRDARVEFRFVYPAGSDTARTVSLEAPADPSGRYRVCGIPTPVEVEAAARAEGAASQGVSFTLSAPGRVDLNFTVDAVATAESLADSLEADLPAAPGPDEVSAVAGRLIDGETGSGIAEATVQIPSLGRRAVTDGGGRFRIDGIPPGDYRLSISHIRYGNPTVEVSVPERRTVALDVRIPPEAIELEAVGVRVERTTRPPYLEDRGFYRRMERDWGHHYAPEYFERHYISQMSQFLQRIPGFRIVNGRIENLRGPGCGRRDPFGGGIETYPVVYVDGHRVGNVMLVRTLSGLVSTGDIGAVEVYRSPSETAPEFVGSGSRCGVIVIWTRHWPGASSSPDRATGGEGAGQGER